MEFYGEYVGFTFAVCKMFPRFDLQQRTVLLWFWGVKPEPFCTRGEGARTDLHPPLINTVELCTQTTYGAVKQWCLPAASPELGEEGQGLPS